MYYIARKNKNDDALISMYPFNNIPYKEVESLPEGPGIICITADGVVYLRPLPDLITEEQNEIKLLKQQLQAASDQNDFLEDCIAEMAEIVYA